MLDLHPDDDIYWCTADPGWVTGTSYGMFAPFTNGVTSVIYEGGFSAAKWYEVIQKYKVTVWYTAPTAIRLLMKAGDHIPARYDLSSLRYTMSVGEPLNPEAVVWGERVIGLPFHDNWWQTETGSIMIANYPIMPIRPGSHGPADARHQPRRDRRERQRGRRSGRRATSRCVRAGRRCSAPTGTTRRCTTASSRTAGTSPATAPAKTPTATSGSSAAPTT